jgi:hypothetical protein
MIDHITELYQHHAEIWDTAKCRKAARRHAKDGMGTRYPFLGYIGNHFGETRYNGGCVREGRWWPGENRPLPVVTDAYEIVRVPTWGYQLRRKGDVSS